MPCSISQARFVFLTPVFTWCFLPFVAFTCAYYLISLYVNVGTRGFDYEAHRGLVATWWPGWHASLDVFLPSSRSPSSATRGPTCSSSPAPTPVPRPSTFSTTVRTRACGHGRRLRVHRSGAPQPGWMKKAGNLRYGFACSSGEFILILDADFAPRADLPAEMLPYLAADPSLGIIQSPQYFRATAQMSWMERGAGAVQELFYRAVQVSRDRHDGAICVGSCAIYRRAALATNGGTSIIEHSEDVHTGFDLRRACGGCATSPSRWQLGCVPPLSHPLPRSAVQVVRRVHVAAGLAEILGRADALPYSLLLLLRVLRSRGTRQCSCSPPRRSPS